MGPTLEPGPPRYIDRFPSEAAVLAAPEGWADDLPDDPWAPRFPQYLDPTADWKANRK